MTTSNLPSVRASQPVAPSFGPTQPEYEVPEGAPDWRRSLYAVLRYRWMILAVTALGTVAGMGATRVVAPEYLTQATIWIQGSGAERRGGSSGAGAPIRSGQLLSEAEAWVDLLKSYVVLDAVVREQRLFLRPKSPADAAALAEFRVGDAFRPGAYQLTVDPGGRYRLVTADGLELERGAIGDSVGATIGFRWAPTRADIGPGGRVEFTLATTRDAARRLADGLTVRMDGEASFLRLETRGSDPVRIAAILNAVVERFVRVAGELKRQRVAELTTILSEQLGTAQQNLRAAENAYERFRVQTITLPSDRPAGAGTGGGGGRGGEAGRDPVLGRFFDMKVDQEQIGQDRVAIERVLAARSGPSADALEAIPSVRQTSELLPALRELTSKQAELRALRYRYTDESPPVRRLLDEIRMLQEETIPRLARAVVAELAARETELDRQVASASRDLRQLPARGIQEARLRRAVDVSEELFTSLQQRSEEARLAEASVMPDVRVFDAAEVPQEPVKNTAPRLILLAFVGSLGMGLMGAVLLDRIDPRVRYPDQVTRGMGLTILGALPHLRNQGARLGEAESTEVMEALRGIRVNVVQAYGAAGPLVLAVSSPGPGDGKSFLAANLGLAFAVGGQRTLIIDGDTRRGVLHRRIGAPRRPGLTDFLGGDALFWDIVRQTSNPFLHLLSSGTRMRNAPELLGSPRMSWLLGELRTSYDVILIDSPPLSAGVDPGVLGMLTGNLLLVLRSGFSRRETTANQLGVLGRLPIRILGAVLNDVPPGTGYGYYSYYLPGYTARDEEPQPAVARQLPRVV